MPARDFFVHRQEDVAFDLRADFQPSAHVSFRPFCRAEGGERGKEKSSDYSPTSANTRKSYVPQLLRTLMASCRRPTPKMAYEILASGNH